MDGVAISWRNSQAFYVPLHRRPELQAALAPLFAAPGLEKATWDLRVQLAALAKVLGRGALGIPGAAPTAGEWRRLRQPRQLPHWLPQWPAASKRLCACRQLGPSTSPLLSTDRCAV